MIPVTVIDTPQGEEAHQYLVLLYDEAGRRALCIWIGAMEAMWIAQGLAHNEPFKRPITYQFAYNLLHATGAHVEAVEISKIVSDVYYATVTVKTPSGETVEVDARPSDALAMAVWNNIPIYVAETVMETQSIVVPEGKLPNRSGIDALLNGQLQIGPLPVKAPEKPDEPPKVDAETLRQKYQVSAQAVIEKAFE